MYIGDFFKKRQPVVSFEIFPPKQTSSFESIVNTTKQLSLLKPDFISITYGAGGSTQRNTLEIAEYIKKTYAIETLAHLTCISNTTQEIEAILDDLQSRGVKNILAMRGDLPAEAPPLTTPVYAKQLIAQIKKRQQFFIAAAAYPEGHIECSSLEQDILYLKEKVAAGAELLISQIFFENQLLYAFMDKLQQANINVALSAGIMPVFSLPQIQRITSLCGATIPAKLQVLLDKYADKPQDLEQAGLEYAQQQISDLCAQKIQGIHIYTMNKPHLAEELVKNTGLRK